MEKNSDFGKLSLEQYRLYMELLRQSSLQSSISNYFFIAMNSAILVINFRDMYQNTITNIGQIFLATFGIILCYYWSQDTRESQILNNVRFRVAMKLETELFELGLLNKEWNMLGEYPFRREATSYVSFRRILPLIYAIGYLVTLAYTLLGGILKIV